MSTFALVLLALLNTIQEPKIAFTTVGAGADSQVDSRFGRAQWVLIYDSASDEWQAIDNSPAVAKRGAAGVGAASLLVRRGVKVVITGECGPKALSTLAAAGVKVYDGSGRTAKQALADYRVGRLREIK